MREKKAKKIGGGNLAGFCKSPEMGTKFAYIRFFLYLCSEKTYKGQKGWVEAMDRVSIEFTHHLYCLGMV